MKVLTTVNFISIIKMNFISYMGGVAEYLRTGRSCVHVHNLTYFDKCMPLNNRKTIYQIYSVDLHFALFLFNIHLHQGDSPSPLVGSIWVFRPYAG